MVTTKIVYTRDIVEKAREAVGIPFKHQGRDSTGLDCVGLLVFISKSLGTEHHDVASYSRRPSNGKLEEAFEEAIAKNIIVRVPVESMQPGDFIMMRISRDPQHLGVYTGNSLIHSYESIGKVCEHIIDDKWRKRIVRVYRVKGVIHE